MSKDQMTLDDITNEAIDRADRNADAEWKREAYKAIIMVTLFREHFTTDDIWERLDKSGAATHEPRALGAVMRKAQSKGIIKPTGEYVRSTRPECHKRPVMIWERVDA